MNQQDTVPAPDAWEALSKAKKDLRERINQGLYAPIGKHPSTVLTDAAALVRLIQHALAATPPEKVDWRREDNHDRQADYLSACCWAAEGLEYFGRTDEVRALVVADGARLRQLLTDGGIPLGHSRLAKQQCHLLLHYVHSTLYRDHQYKDSLALIDQSEEKIVLPLVSPKDQCFRTRIRLASMRGAVQRQLGDLFESRRSYQAAVDLLRKRLEHEHGKGEVSPEEKFGRLHEVKARSFHELAKCFLHGFGFTRYTEGLLVQAQADVSAALAMLAGIDDFMTRAYALLIEATIDRCMAGYDAGLLRQAIAKVEVPRAVFDQYGHHRYRSRCDYESAIGHLYLGRTEKAAAEKATRDRASDDTAAAQKAAGQEASRETLLEARKRIARVHEYAQKVNDRNWQAIALTVASRIARSQGLDDDSAELADQALKMSEKASRQVRVDALVAKGASLLVGEVGGARVEEAVGRFESALAIATNPKAKGNCYIHLADANLRRGNLKEAADSLNHWKSISGQVQHAFVHAYAATVETRLRDRQRDFFTIGPDDSLDSTLQDKRLRRYLVDQAEKRGGDKPWERLGVSKSTFYDWKEKLSQLAE